MLALGQSAVAAAAHKPAPERLAPPAAFVRVVYQWLADECCRVIYMRIWRTWPKVAAVDEMPVNKQIELVIADLVYTVCAQLRRQAVHIIGNRIAHKNRNEQVASVGKLVI